MRTTYRFCVVIIVCLAISSIGCNKSNNPADPNAAASPADANQQANASGGNASGNPGATRQAAEPVVIPAGKMITVRLSQSLNSKENHAGDSFSGSLAEPVEVEGRTVIPRGAAAHGTVVEAQAMGHFKGGALLQLQLTSISINGERRPVETQIWSRTLKGKGKRTAVLAGGGAGVGALIGGLAGGGKGAAIGALAGGGAGTAGAAYTGNKEIQLAAESAVQFKLKQSIHLQ